MDCGMFRPAHIQACTACLVEQRGHEVTNIVNTIPKPLAKVFEELIQRLLLSVVWLVWLPLLGRWWGPAQTQKHMRQDVSGSTDQELSLVCVGVRVQCRELAGSPVRRSCP